MAGHSKWANIKRQKARVDPYATDIDDSTQNGVVRIKDGQKIVDTYVWQHDDQPLTPDHELVIYEMHVGDFSGGENDSHPRGKYKNVVEKLDYFCELGVNVIELMPIKEYPGDHSWGYNPRHFFATWRCNCQCLIRRC